MNANPAWLTTLAVGRDRIEEPTAKVRDIRQHQAVAAIVADPSFAFSCTNPFIEEEVGDYTGPFAFLYYTTDGLMHLRRIGKTGRILSAYDATPDPEPPVTTYHCVCSQFSYLRAEDGVLVTTGCGPTPIGRRSKFAPGHDAKLKKLLVAAYFNGSEHFRVNGEPSSSLLLDHARSISDRYALSVAAMIDNRSRALQREISSLASGLSRPSESRATRAVFRALQVSDGQRNSHEPIGHRFGNDFDVYVDSAKAWLRDHSELKSSTIEKADWASVYNWFILDEPA